MSLLSMVLSTCLTEQILRLNKISENEYYRNINKTPLADYRTFQRICPVGNYRTNSNEILRLALCNVHFKYADFDEPIDSNSKNIVDNKTRTIIIEYPNGNQKNLVS